MADVSPRPIRRLLIANRGEIARRIIRTAHRMGIATVAVYADGDAGAPHVREADAAVALRGRASADTYLRMFAHNVRTIVEALEQARPAAFAKP
jgi:acetyl/propionyl-CoA carboxylase alpha subunit